MTEAQIRLSSLLLMFQELHCRRAGGKPLASSVQVYEERKSPTQTYTTVTDMHARDATLY